MHPSGMRCMRGWWGWWDSAIMDERIHKIVTVAREKWRKIHLYRHSRAERGNLTTVFRQNREPP